MQVKHNLKPIYDEYSNILILGSMPSIKSREIGFYYAYKYNRFWPIMESIYNVTLPDIDSKIKFLHNNHIALWDTFSQVDINKSSDASISNIIPNNIDIIISNSNIKKIYCTGKVAYNYAITHYHYNIPIIYLPSPSSANATFSLEDLIHEYSIIRN